MKAARHLVVAGRSFCAKWSRAERAFLRVAGNQRIGETHVAWGRRQKCGELGEHQPEPTTHHADWFTATGPAQLPDKSICAYTRKDHDAHCWTETSSGNTGTIAGGARSNYRITERPIQALAGLLFLAIRHRNSKPQQLRFIVPSGIPSLF
jgi:hypothetical protein